MTTDQVETKMCRWCGHAMHPCGNLMWCSNKNCSDPIVYLKSSIKAEFKEKVVTTDKAVTVVLMCDVVCRGCKWAMSYVDEDVLACLNDKCKEFEVKYRRPRINIEPVRGCDE